MIAGGAMMIAAVSRRTSGGNNGARMTSGANKTATKNRADNAAVPRSLAAGQAAAPGKLTAFRRAVIVQHPDKLPLILRVWPFEGASQWLDKTRMVS